MRTQIFSILFLLISFGIANAQQKELTVADVAYDLYVKSYYANPSDFQFRSGSNDVTFSEKENIYKIDATGKRSEIVKFSDLSTAIEKAGIEKISNLSSFSWYDNNQILIDHNSNFILYDVIKKQVTRKTKYDEKADDIEFDNDKNQFAYTIENNLFVSKNDGKEFQITKDENKGIVNGKSVHRQEFGIEKGIFWSPKGSSLAFYRMDETMVTDFPLVDITTRIAQVENIKYPMAGMKSHEVTVGIYNLATNKTIFVKTGEPAEQYLTNIAWSPDEKTVYVAVLNREQNIMKFNAYDAETGNFIKTLFEEKNEKYVEPLVPMLFVKNSNDKFIWQSQRDGFNHLYLYDTQGNLLKQLTKGNYVVLNILGFDESGKNVFITHTDEKRAIETHVSMVNIETQQRTQITTVAGTHTCTLNGTGKYLLDDFSSLSVYREINLISVDDKKSINALKCENVYAEYNLPKQEIFTIKADDNKTDLYCSMIKPLDFDPNKKYPVIVYVYGGPHAQMINDTWLGGISNWDFLMAQKGYIMFTVDNRGSANRGLEFENVIHRKLGENEMADQMKGIEFLKSQKYVDADKIGVHGWSFGGFMTTNLMVNYSDVFKVGVAGGPVMDWKYYEVMYGERYMDTPDENSEGYKNANLVEQAGKLKGKLLLIHGAIDNTVVWQHSLAFVQKCIEENVQVDYFPYPRAEHNVRGQDRIHLMQKITDYFDDYLK
jgi:dipeptidyl-peptidase-4